MIFVNGFYRGVEYDEHGQPQEGCMLTLTDGNRSVSVPIDDQIFELLHYWLQTEGEETPLPAEPMTRPAPAPDELEVDDGYQGDVEDVGGPFVPQNDVLEAAVGEDDFSQPPSAVFAHEPDVPGELHTPSGTDDDGVGQI